MNAGKLMAVVVALAAAGTGVYVWRAGGVDTSDADGPVVIARRAPPAPAPAADPGVEPAPEVQLPPAPPYTDEIAARLEEYLVRFDRIWISVQGLRGREYGAAIHDRSRRVEHLAGELAAEGEEMLPPIRARFTDVPATYPRKTFLVQTLSKMGTADSLRHLAWLAAEYDDWRLREYSMRQFVKADPEVAVPVLVEWAPKLDDHRLIVPIFRANWTPDQTEKAYLAWVRSAESQSRNKSYSALYRAEGEWVDDLLRDLAAADHPAPERAGALNALAFREPDGILYFFADMLWEEKDERVIKTLIGAIRRVGGEEGLRILADYIASEDATEEMRAYAQMALERPDMEPQVIRPGKDGATLGTMPLERPPTGDLRRTGE